ncbi:hypothetical protein [Stakelama tenebrarum]|uniref:Uncharacterized protein n=1 Tax=Stakelama tenebrarum TaxID=2711215 RepID=A0A6G6Y4G2_9SPHN|nr:hypothetical protein [Sphingosinithalassobacter tenebrarum]QIG79493.1 hypothetical protein G5C33_06610 [Sphingosinithalassobacter tenebrarum]
MTDRYQGKPFLKLLDSYVLDCIGHLDTTSEAALTAMEPQLRHQLKLEGGWREMVVSQMQFPKGMEGAIREVWEKGKPQFRESQGRDPDPVEFTHVFVDTNFPH